MLGRKGLATQHEYVLWRTSMDGSVYLRNANQRRILAKAAEIVAKHKGVNENAQKEFSQWITKAEGLSGGERAYRNLSVDGRVWQSVGMEAPEQRTDPKYFEPLVHPKTGKPCPTPKSGWSRKPETIAELLLKDEIAFGADETVQPRLKVFLRNDSRRQVPSVFSDSSRGKTDVQHLGLEFPYCHPLSLYVELVGASTDREDAVVLDYFAGSGTNGHAVIALNRDEGTRRRFVLAEVGHHFDTVLIPRIKKASFCADWKDGFPQVPENGTVDLWSPDVVRVVRLEQYEDTLNNLEMKRPGAAEGLFSGDDQALREEYILRYMLDVESRGSASLLNTSMFADPRKYTLRVKSPGSDETKESTVDLLETFNWLLGLRIRHIAASATFSATFSEIDKRLSAELTVNDDGEYWFRQVRGVLPDGRDALVVWRTLTGDVEKDEAVLLSWFDTAGHLRSETLDVVFVNGDCNLAAARPAGARWEIEPLETRFEQLMFDGVDS